MSNRFKIIRPIAFILTGLTVTAVIASQNTLTTPRIVIAVALTIIGAVLLLLFDKLEMKDTGTVIDPAVKIPFKDLVVATFRKKPYTSVYEGELSESEMAENRPGQAFMLQPIPLILMIFVNLLGVIVRVVFFKFASEDLISLQYNWHEELAGHGLEALAMRGTDFSPLYSAVFALLCQTPLSVQFITKLIPATVDFLLAMIGLLIFHELKDGKETLKERIAVYSCILFNPLLILNASCWGQFDSVYATFIFLSVYIILRCTKHRSKYGGDLAMIYMGIAFSLKFQTIFIMPLTLLVWLLQKEKILLISQKMWIPVIYFLTCLPSLIMGKPLKELFAFYAGQAGSYNMRLNVRYPNFYSLVYAINENATERSANIGGTICFAFLLGLFLWLFFRKTKLSETLILKSSVLIVLTMVFFLPHNRDRYAFTAEMLVIVLAVAEHEYIAYAITTVAVTLIEYVSFLRYGLDIGGTLDLIFAAARLIVIILIAFDILKLARLEREKAMAGRARRTIHGGKQ